MSVMQAYSPQGRAALVVPTNVILFFYAATAAVVFLGIAREAFVFLVGTETILQDLRHFALDAERNLGAWYSSALMVLIATCAFFSWRKDPFPFSLSGYGWLVIAVVFAALSIDETVGFHETVDKPLRAHFELTGFFFNPWVFFGAALVSAFALSMVPFILSLPRQVAALFVLSGAIYVGGALGMEPFDAFFESTYGIGSYQQVISTTIEEALEMIGLTLFLHANLIFMADARTTLLLRR